VPCEPGELQRGLHDVSPKVLTQTLRSMERDGLIERSVFAEVPPRVEYMLTEMGQTVLVALRELCHWAKANSARRDAARRKFDAGADGAMRPPIRPNASSPNG
jgi:DNA-binding HxlR family transcriptional regulator